MVQPAIARFTRVARLRPRRSRLERRPVVPAHIRPASSEELPVGARPRSHRASAASWSGHSFGSFVVRGFAMRHPEAVAGLVLVGSGDGVAHADTRARLPADGGPGACHGSARGWRASASFAPAWRFWSAGRLRSRGASPGCSVPTVSQHARAARRRSAQAATGDVPVDAVDLVAAEVLSCDGRSPR